MQPTKSETRAAHRHLPFAIGLILFCLGPFGHTAPLSPAGNVTVSPAAINLVAPFGIDTGVYQPITLNADTAGLSYTVTLSGNWLGTSRFSGSIPGSLSVAAVTKGLAVGVYQGSVTFTVDGAANAPSSFPLLSPSPAPPVTGPSIPLISPATSHSTAPATASTARSLMPRLSPAASTRPSHSAAQAATLPCPIAPVTS